MEKVKKKLEETYTQVQNAIGWTVDKRILLSIASFYVTTSKTFNGQRFLAVSDTIKEKSSWTSPLRSQAHYMLVACLENESQNPSEAVDTVLAKHNLLKEVGFKQSLHSYLTTLLMSDYAEKQASDVTRAMALFNEMKKHHPFLTSADDYLYAMMLGKMEGNAVERADTMNRYYRKLRKHGFYMGNELQCMSQVMTYTGAEYDENIVSRAVSIRDQLKTSGVKIKMSHYVMVAFLAVLNVTDMQLQHSIETYRELSDMKLFRWYKDMVLPIAVQLETKHMIDQLETSSVQFLSTIEMVIQAQQAAMVASMAATSSIIASSGN